MLKSRVLLFFCFEISIDNFLFSPRYFRPLCVFLPYLNTTDIKSIRLTLFEQHKHNIIVDAYLNLVQFCRRKNSTAEPVNSFKIYQTAVCIRRLFASFLFRPPRGWRGDCVRKGWSTPHARAVDRKEERLTETKRRGERKWRTNKTFGFRRVPLVSKDHGVPRIRSRFVNGRRAIDRYQRFVVVRGEVREPETSGRFKMLATLSRGRRLRVGRVIRVRRVFVENEKGRG